MKHIRSLLCQKDPQHKSLTTFTQIIFTYVLSFVQVSMAIFIGFFCWSLLESASLILKFGSLKLDTFKTPKLCIIKFVKPP